MEDRAVMWMLIATVTMIVAATAMGIYRIKSQEGLLPTVEDGAFEVLTEDVVPRCRVTTANGMPFEFRRFGGIQREGGGVDGKCIFPRVPADECKDLFFEGDVVRSIAPKAPPRAGCVVHLKQGLTGEAYKRYEDDLIDASTLKSKPYVKLISSLDDVATTIAEKREERDALTEVALAQSEMHKMQHARLMSAYGTYESGLMSDITASAVSSKVVDTLDVAKKREARSLAGLRDMEKKVADTSAALGKVPNLREMGAALAAMDGQLEMKDAELRDVTKKLEDAQREVAERPFVYAREVAKARDDAEKTCAAAAAAAAVVATAAAAVTTSSASAITYNSLGCWADHHWKGIPRPIPIVEDTDPTLTGNWGSRDNAIEKCFQVAKKRGHKVFAVQADGACLMGPDAEKNYKRDGMAFSCRNGRGASWANDVYRVVSADDPEVTAVSRATSFSHLGCWADHHWKAIPRPVTMVEGSDPSLRDNYKTRTDATRKCFEVAKKRGNRAFAVQDGGSCMTDADALVNYNRDGPSTACWGGGKGGTWANDVYIIDSNEPSGTGSGPAFQFGMSDNNNTTFTMFNYDANFQAIFDRVLTMNAFNIGNTSFVTYTGHFYVDATKVAIKHTPRSGGGMRWGDHMITFNMIRPFTVTTLKVGVADNQPSEFAILMNTITPEQMTQLRSCAFFTIDNLSPKLRYMSDRRYGDGSKQMVTFGGGLHTTGKWGTHLLRLYNYT